MILSFGDDVGATLTDDEAAFLRDFTGGGVAVSHDASARGPKGPDPETAPSADPDFNAGTGTYLPIDPLSPAVTLPVVKPKAAAPATTTIGKVAIAAGALVGLGVAVYFVGRAAA